MLPGGNRRPSNGEMANLRSNFCSRSDRKSVVVTWPSRKETTVTTVMVFAMVVIAAVFFFLVDDVLARGVQFVLGHRKLKR